ncbi:4-hydroxyphenylpyruvate dioxygenase [Kitasatospora sp. NPDC003701]
MDIQGIDHVEFYVGDAQQSAFWFCTALGFRLCGESEPTDHRSLLLRQGGIQVLLTSPLSEHHPAADFVRRHGDGLAVIALETTSAAAAYETAVAAGAAPLAAPVAYEQDGTRVVTAEVAAFGDVVHRFVERHGGTEEFLPGVVGVLAPDPEPADDLLTEIDHFAVVVPAGELTGTVEYYRRVFGFEQIFEEFIEVGEQAMDSKVVQSPSGKVTLTLIEPVTDRRPGQIDEFLTRHGGAGVQHMALLTGDIIHAVKTLERRGVTFLQTPASYYDLLEERLGTPDVKIPELRETNVLVDRDHWGQLFQIFTRSMHVRRTYFMEVIDRHGARTFGSGNIKALYEAVEREKVGA